MMTTEDFLPFCIFLAQLMVVQYWPKTNKASRCSASFLGYQHGTVRICCRAPCCGAVAARRLAAAAVDRYLLPDGAQQQTRRMPLLRSNDGTDDRTDGHPTVT